MHFSLRLTERADEMASPINNLALTGAVALLGLFDQLLILIPGGLGSFLRDLL